MFEDALSASGLSIRNSVQTAVKVLLIVVMTQAADMMFQEKNTAVAAAGAMGVIACCTSDVRSMIGLGHSTLEEINAFSTFLIPVMGSAAAASGSVVKANTVCLLTTAFSSLLIRLSNRLLIPLLYVCLSLSLVDTVLETPRMSRMRTLLEWFEEKGLKTVMYLYTGFLGISGMIAGNTDAAALKAAKLTLSGMIPVVGGIISDAADTVLSGAAFLKNTVGTFGMLSVLSVFIVPFLKIGISFLIFKIVSAISGMLESRITELLDCVSRIMGYLLGMTGSCGLITMLSCLSFMKTVTW